MAIKAIFNGDKSLLSFRDPMVSDNCMLNAFPFCCPRRAEQQPLSTTSLTSGSSVYPVLSWRSSAPEQPASALEDSSAPPIHPPVTVPSLQGDKLQKLGLEHGLVRRSSVEMLPLHDVTPGHLHWALQSLQGVQYFLDPTNIFPQKASDGLSFVTK